MVQIKLHDTQVSVDKAQWSDEDGLLIPWHFPCLFWKECDAEHCDLTGGDRSTMNTHCSLPDKLEK